MIKSGFLPIAIGRQLKNHFEQMKQVNITINVTDNKFDKLVTFLTKHFGEVTVNEAEDIEVPEWQKKIVFDRIKKAKEEDFIPLSELDDRIKL
jgi:hypothetical protein